MSNYIEDWLSELAFKAYLEARKNKRGTQDEQRFEKDVPVNIALLVRDIINRTYKPSRGIAFIIEDPVKREIFAAPFRDRVVHHILHNLNSPWWEKRFIYDNYSCRVGKGTLFGIKRLQHHIMSVSENGQKEAYCLKLDLQGYFMSLSRARLYERVLWGLERQFELNSKEFALCNFLWKQIIFDDPTQGVNRKDKISLWKDLPKNKSLFHSPPGHGIVIGNLTSQLLSNIYLDLLDRFATFDLGFKNYGRYVDDFYIVHKNREVLANSIDKFAKFLDDLELVLHPKKRYLQEVSNGVDFLGAVVYPFRLQVGKRLKKKLPRVIPYANDAQLISYKGHTKHFKDKKLWAVLEKQRYKKLGVVKEDYKK
jgi:hypothetical protein